MARLKSKPSPNKNVSVRKSDDMGSTDDSFGTNDKKTKRTSRSKRKSLLPTRRHTLTEQFKSHSKSIRINRFGKPESCSKKTLNELKFYGRSTFLLIPKLPFSRVVREIMGQFANLRITQSALEALQEATEIHIVTMFQACNVAAGHAKRKTVMPNDFGLVNFIRKLHG